MMQTAFLFVGLGLPVLVCAQTAVFKCTDAKGSVSIQQAPCSGAGQVMNVYPGGSAAPQAPPQVQGQSQSVSRESRNAGADADKRAAAVSAGLAGGYPAVGMNMNQLAQVLGHPTRTNTSDRGRGIEEQRIYERGTQTYYVYTENGLVRSIQTSASRPTVARSCPTDLDIRNLETTASSVGQSDASRAALQRQIADMRACR
jgi:hypothetical protein